MLETLLAITPEKVQRHGWFKLTNVLVIYTAAIVTLIGLAEFGWPWDWL